MFGSWNKKRQPGAVASTELETIIDLSECREVGISKQYGGNNQGWTDPFVGRF